MKTFGRLKEGFSLILKKRTEDNMSLVAAKKQYNSLLKELIEKINQKSLTYDLSVGDYQVSDQTTFQEFDIKLKNIIEFIEIQFTSEMDTTSNG